jgi:hypothetical protein
LWSLIHQVFVQILKKILWRTRNKLLDQISDNFSLFSISKKYAKIQQPKFFLEFHLLTQSEFFTFLISMETIEYEEDTVVVVVGVDFGTSRSGCAFVPLNDNSEPVRLINKFCIQNLNQKV